MYTVGEAVPQLWTRLSKPDPTLTTKLTGRRSEQMDDTRVSESAPLWMTTLNSYEPSPLMPWDFITKDRKKHLRHAVNDDTAVSVDAPEWFNQKLKTKDQPKLTKPVGTFRLGALPRVMLKPLIEIDPYKQHLPSAVEPTKCRPGYIPTEQDKLAHSLPPTGTLPARFGSTTSAEIGAGDVDYEIKQQKNAPRDRLGKTSSSFIGSGTEIASFASDKISDTRRALEKSSYNERTKALLLQETIHQRNTIDLHNTQNSNIKLHYTTAKYTEEPPFRSYFNKVNEGQPDGSVTARPLRTGRAGHKLWAYEVNNFGTLPAQHLGATVNTLYEQGIGNVTARLVSPNNNQSDNLSSSYRPESPQHPPRSSLTNTSYMDHRPSTTPSRPSLSTTNLRQVPLNWYNASR